MYTATTLRILRNTGDIDNCNIESYECSLGGGKITPENERFLSLLVQYSKGELHTIKDINTVQNFLNFAGRNLSNIILISASPLFIIDK